MGGDLNLKKSWHPVLMSNQKRVWEEEKKALDERKRTEQRVKELKEERAKEEIQAKLEAAGSRKRVDRVDWMYQGPSSGQVGTTEEMEGYLLGKRRIDGLIKGTEHKSLEKQASQDSFLAVQSANMLRDTASKIREDPMLAIKKQEQAAYEAMMNDPIKRKQFLASAGQLDQVKPKSEKKHRRHHHRHREDSDDERRHMRRHRDEDDRDHLHRRSEHRRRRSDTYSRSPSPERRRDDGDKRRSRRSQSPSRRSLSPRYRRRRSKEGDYRKRDPSSNESRSPSRDARARSPHRRHTYPSQREERSDASYQQSRSWGNDSRNGRDGRDVRNGRNGHGQYNEGSNGAPAKSFTSVDERQRRLAAMQEDASSLDADRERRLAALAEQERAAREADELARARSSKYGNKGEFINAVHRKAGELALGDRIGRGRQGLIKEVD